MTLKVGWVRGQSSVEFNLGPELLNHLHDSPLRMITVIYRIHFNRNVSTKLNLDDISLLATGSHSRSRFVI